MRVWDLSEVTGSCGLVAVMLWRCLIPGLDAEIFPLEVLNV